MAKLSLRAVQKLTCKKRDAWWTVLLVDPVATRVLIRIARFGFITPNGVTWGALFVGLGSAGFFLRGDTQSLIIGAVLYHISFILDCIDGKLARLKGNGTVFGGWLDYVFDRIRVLFCALALMGGQYLRTESAWYLVAALVVVFLDMLRYVDALQIYKMRMSMRTKIEKVKEAARLEAEQAHAAVPQEPKVVFMEDLLRENPGVEADILKQQAAGVVDLHAQFRDRFPWYTRVRQALLRSRVRPHLISGIEFQMFIFIVGPLIGQILWTTAVSAILLGLFELVIMYKFWLSTRDFTRVMEEIAPAAAPSGGAVANRLHAGRHRRAADLDQAAAPGGGYGAIPVEQRFPAPEPYENPGFQPYPEHRAAEPYEDPGFQPYQEPHFDAGHLYGSRSDNFFAGPSVSHVHSPGPHPDVNWAEAEGPVR